jgi:cAMP phosphodiesterase
MYGNISWKCVEPSRGKKMRLTHLDIVDYLVHNGPTVGLIHSMYPSPRQLHMTDIKKEELELKIGVKIN